MTQPRSSSAGMAAIAALVIGAVVAVIVDAMLTVGISFLYESSDLGLGMSRLIAALTAVIVGASIGGATLVTRPSGPLIPVLAAVLVLPASFVGDLLGIAAHGTFRGRPLLVQFELYVESYTRITMFFLLTLLLYPAVAFGVSALRHLRRTSGTRNAGPPWGGAYGGQAQPPQPGHQQPPYQQPGFQQPGAQPYQLPGAQPPHGQPQYGQPQYGQQPGAQPSPPDMPPPAPPAAPPSPPPAFPPPA